MVGIGIVGIGFMGMTHFKAVVQIAAARVVAICTRSKKKRAGDWRDVQGNFGANGGVQNLEGISTSPRFDDLICDPDIDLIDICLPSAMHASTAIAALEAGKHVLVEKPIALSVKDADRMIAAARSTGRQLMVAHVLRFVPEWVFLKQVMDGRFGRLLTLNIQRIISLPDWSEGIAGPKVNGGPLIDLHIHDVDFVLHLLGRPKRIASVGREADGCVLYVSTLYDYGDGATVTSRGGAVARKGRPFMQAYEACFEKATVTVSTATEPLGNDPASRHSQTHELIVYGADGQASFPTPEGPDPFIAQLEHAAQCVSRDKPSTLISAESAREALALCFLEGEAIRRGQYMDVPC
jgi:predicted dehydrogenase